MKSWLQKHFQRYMIRPVVYQTFTRVVMGLTLALLWNEFTNVSSTRLPLAYALVVIGIFYGICAWMAYLRLDGLSMPKFDRKLFQFKKKEPIRSSYGDMADHIDDEIISFEELEDDEKDACLLVSNLLCVVIFLVASFIVW